MAKQKAETFKVRVDVTQSNINRGTCTDPEKCAIAKALLGTKLFSSVSVGGGTYATRKRKVGGGRFFAKLPKRASKFIDMFDSNKTNVKPFSFNLSFKQIA